MSIKINMDKPENANMCYGCEVYCCSLLVDLTSYDIYRIMMEQKKNLDDFVDVVFADRDDLYGFRAQGIMVKLVLRHKGKYCIFFDKESKLKCTIDKSKPSICLAYPFSMYDGKLRTDVLCPAENLKKADTVKMSPEVLSDCLWETERFTEIVNDWNMHTDGSKTVADFLRFAAFEMAIEKNPLGSAFRKAKRRLFRKLYQL